MGVGTEISNGGRSCPNYAGYILGMQEGRNLVHETRFYESPNITIKCYHLVVRKRKLDCVIVIYLNCGFSCDLRFLENNVILLSTK